MGKLADLIKERRAYWEQQDKPDAEDYVYCRYVDECPIMTGEKPSRDGIPPPCGWPKSKLGVFKMLGIAGSCEALDDAGYDSTDMEILDTAVTLAEAIEKDL